MSSLGWRTGEHKLQDDALKRGSNKGSIPSSIPAYQELGFPPKKWPEDWKVGELHDDPQEER
jgi:hypothetical protein